MRVLIYKLLYIKYCPLSFRAHYVSKREIQLLVAIACFIQYGGVDVRYIFALSKTLIFENGEVTRLRVPALGSVVSSAQKLPQLIKPGHTCACPLQSQSKIVCTGVKRCPLKPKNFIYYCWARVLVMVSVRKTLCDVYIIWQESHYVGVLVNPRPGRLYSGMSRFQSLGT